MTTHAPAHMTPFGTIAALSTVIILGMSTVTTSAQAQMVSPLQPAPTSTGDLIPLDRPAQSAPAASQASSAFAFTNTLEYGDCLETILQLYERSDNLSDRVKQGSCYQTIQQTYGDQGLTRSQALSLVSSADFYATHFLSRQLFPLRGQRIRIAERFGFIYEVDSDDDDMKERAASAQAAEVE